MSFNREMPGFDPSMEQPESERRTELTLTDAKKYLTEHLHEPGFEDAHLVLNWQPIDALPYFETHCETLREAGSPDLYKARELTRVLDRETHSGGHIAFDKEGVSLLLMDGATEKFRSAPKGDSLEIQEASAEYEEDLAEIRTYIKMDTIEPVLGLVEEHIALLNKQIDNKSREPNKNRRNEREHSDDVKALEETRKKYRRARIFLMNQYFPK
jgi:hypothetical protein